MVSIVTDNAEVKDCLETLLTLTRGNGAIFSDDLILKCINGKMSVEAPPAETGRVLIKLPRSCLIPLEQISLTLSGDDIQIKSFDPDMPDTLRTITQTLIKLYNLTGKIPELRYTSTALFLSHHQMLTDVICSGRNGEGFKNLIKKISSPQHFEQSIIENFTNCRSFSYKDGNNPPISVLMPIIDFLNHHANGARFEIIPEHDQPASLQIRSAPHAVKNSSECYVLYGVYDCFDTLLKFNFPDADTFFLRSVPLRIDLGNAGAITVLADTTGAKPQDVPDAVKDIRIYYPAVLKNENSHMTVSFLIIPGIIAPRSLRRILQSLMRQMNISESAIPALIMSAEQQILATNKNYYDKLKSVLNALTISLPHEREISAMFMQMCNRQLAQLAEYKTTLPPAMP